MQLVTAVLAASETDVPGDPLYPIIPHLGELVFGFVAILIILLYMWKRLVPRMEQMYAERRAAIEGNVEQAEAAQREAEETLQQYRAQLADARAEAGRIREDARAQGAQILEEMRQRAEAEAQRVTESAQRQIQAERQQALLSLRGEVGGLATDLASRIVGESLADEARQSRVVDRFLEELERGDAEAAAVGASAGVPTETSAEAGGAHRAEPPSRGGFWRRS